MPSGSFQVPPLPSTALEGRIDARVLDSGGNPPDVIKVSDPWSVEFRWTLTGFLVPLITGHWLLRLSIEQLGGNNDLVFPTNPTKIALNGNGSYRATINVPNTVLKASAGGSVYRIVASLGYEDSWGKPGPIGGYVDCGVVNVMP